MRIFVTGGTGFIGGHFIARALADGHEVRALRRPGSMPVVALSSESEWADGDLENVPDSAWAGVDALVHAAAVGVSPRVVSWAEAMRWNVVATERLLSQAHRRGVGRVLLCGTCHEFGRTGVRYERVPANAALDPVGTYATSKAMASVLATGMARELGFELTIARLFHCYGSGQHRDSLWPALRAAAHAGRDFAMTAGEQVYDFSPVEVSVAKLCALLTTGSESVGEPRQVNVGSGVAVRLADFAREWWARWNAQGELRLGAVPYRRGEIMRLVPALAGENCV